MSSLSSLMALRVVALVLTTPTARALTPPTRVLPGRRAVAVAAAPAALPTLAAACAVPTCLGFYKREYGVSYGYGLSIAAAAGLVLKRSPRASRDRTRSSTSATA